ncbi:glomulin-like isoform X1 [Leptidea sinapis]|uniref:glomulin-like isoform X1 n=1 Tax=Leptidea sinapis TaxID=189913 RepID=UPI00212B182C|nr:glomulin-like isoform X1 [Leptidea sinapis]
MEHQHDVVGLISILLDSEKYKEALRIPLEERYIQSFKDNCWDLISNIINKINNDTITLKPSLYGACEELLSIIIDKATPEEALLEFIEQIEVAKNDAQFSIILKPLQQLLKKLICKRGRSLEWCLNSISTYIEAIPIPDHNLEGKERILMDSDDNIRRIIRVYSLLPPFYKPFINEMAPIDSNKKTPQIIASFLISLLGKPLIYIDLDPGSNSNGEARLCCSTILSDICLLVKNILKLLPYLEDCYTEVKNNTTRKTNIDDDVDLKPFDHTEKINITTLSGLFYGIFSTHFEVPDLAIPQVYSSQYIVHSVLPAVIHLLQFIDCGPQAKGIFLCENLLTYYPNNMSHSILSIPVHYDLCKILINVSIYSYYETLRKQAVKLIKAHISKFNYKGRNMLIKYIIDNANHSGMIGYAITLYKNSLDEAFQNKCLPDCFTGTHFNSMLKKFCHLPHGEESDLMELADQIITTLNFLRYITLKDTNNVTGIRECFSSIQNDFLEKLRMGLNMSKAHYEAKLKEIENKHGSKKQTNVAISIGGNVLDKIPKQNKKAIINSALNAFHLIEGLIGRLSECITINKSLLKN